MKGRSRKSLLEMALCMVFLGVIKVPKPRIGTTMHVQKIG